MLWLLAMTFNSTSFRKTPTFVPSGCVRDPGERGKLTILRPLLSTASNDKIFDEARIDELELDQPKSL